ncbi:MAG: hypothetical protein MJ177_03645 [Clostridia bacterium]|nr:hypothetical protein [Clostridia bacterium]
MKVLKIIKKIIIGIFALAFGAFAATQAVYWLNLDNKAIFILHRVLNKHYDKVPRDRHF